MATHEPVLPDASASIKLHLPSSSAAETCCGLPLATVVLGAYSGHSDVRGHWRGILFGADGREGYACRGCITIYERQQLAIYATQPKAQAA